MKVAFFTQYFHPEGGACSERLTSFATYLSAFGHDVSVITPYPSAPQGKVFPGYKNRRIRREAFNGMTVIRVPSFISHRKDAVSRTLGYVTFMLSATLPGLRAKDSVLVGTSGPIFTPVAPLLVSRLRGNPLFLDLRDLWTERITVAAGIKSRLVMTPIMGIEKALYKHSSRIAVISGSMKREITAKGVPEDKILFLPNGADLNIYNPQPPDLELKKKIGLPEDSFTVIYSGTMGLIQDGQTIMAAAELLKSHGDIHFLMVGGGVNLGQWKEQASGMGLQNIIFIPPVSSRDVANLINISDMGINVNKAMKHVDAHIPVKLFGYMACRKPSVTANEGEGKALVEKEGAGIAVPPESPEKLADAILYLRNNRSAAEEMGNRGFTVVSKSYSRETMARRLEQALKDVVDTRTDK